ncbi:MAG: HalD/BesD family halogenase [Rhodospirillales bacterium]
MTRAPNALDVCVDLGRYPVHAGGAARDALIAECRKALADDGCCHLPAFLNAAGIDAFHAAAAECAPHAFRSEETVNPYFGDDDPALDPGHPLRRFETRSNGFVPADRIGGESPLRGLFERPEMTAFFSDCLEIAPLYVYADPLADVIINTADPGKGFPWHFDTNDFSVTIMVDPAERGGMFEYVPNLRAPGDENFEGVRRILDGGRENRRTLDLRPGDLQIFRGRNSMHRVTDVEGATQRRVVIYSYTREPGVIGKPKRMKQLYGKALPVHYEAEKAAARADALLD